MPKDETIKKAAKKRKAPAGKAKPKKGPVTAITPESVKKAKKAQLVEFCEELDLSAEGKVDELRERLIEYLEKHPEAAPKLEEALKEKGEEREEEAEEGEVEIEEGKAYVAKAKAKLPEDVRVHFKLRAELAKKRPRFLRQEWFRYKRLGLKWRRPQGGQSKLRRHFKYRINVASIGYRSPTKSRGLHPSGFSEVLVHNPSQVEGLDPATQAVRIAHAVGMRKRKLIEEAADDKGLRILNRSGEVES